MFDTEKINKIIEHLNAELTERDAKLADYDTAKAEVERLEVELATAKEKVEKFGDVSALTADRDEIKGYIEYLTVGEPETIEAKTEEATTETTEQPVEGTPAQPFFG